MATEFADLREITESMRAYIEEFTGIPTYTERMPANTSAKLIVVYLDDANPWQGNHFKERTFNFKIAFRFNLSDLGSDYLEIDAQSESYDLLCRLEFDSIPPGISAQHYLTRCGLDDNGRYVVEMTIQSKSVN